MKASDKPYDIVTAEMGANVTSVPLEGKVAKSGTWW